MNGLIPFLYYDRKVKTRRYNEYLRDILDPFNISDRCFIDNYRLPKHLVLKLIEDMKPFIHDDEHPLKIPIHLEVLTTLNFLASGSHQRRVSLDAFAVMSQSKVSLSITRVCEVIGTKLVNEHVVFPTTLALAETGKTGFYEKYGIPGIVGLVDCTHIAITQLKKTEEYAYINRKNFHSVNTQMICDSNLTILNINARYPGSCHDSHIWEGSKVSSLVERLNREDNNTWLFGDSGYGLKSYMMVPYRRVASDDERQFNTIHSKIRSTIERCFGVLKIRFRCLKTASGHLHYEHRRVANIIHSCAVLHNILIKNNCPVIENDGAPDEIVPVSNAEEESNSGELNRQFLSNYIKERGIIV